MRFSADIEKLLDEAAERAVGVYYEKTQDDFARVIEALDAANVNLNKIPKMEEDIEQLKSDMVMVKAAIKDTNEDLRKLGHSW